MGRKNEEPARIRIEGDDYDRAQQVLLTPDQVQELAAFLAAGPDGP